jgi:hypothetical protein
MSGRKHSFGGLVGSGIGLLAIYAGVRAALRADETARATSLGSESRTEAGGSQTPLVKDRAHGASPGSGSRRGQRTYRELYEEAQRRGIPGRSSMKKADLESALSRAPKQ